MLTFQIDLKNHSSRQAVRITLKNGTINGAVGQSLFSTPKSFAKTVNVSQLAVISVIWSVINFAMPVYQPC
jgi:hypothetical protein